MQMRTNIDTAAVVGAGYMGGGIAQSIALAEVEVHWRMPILT